eukprot:c39954_g1_i1 orf=3-170(-)
MTKGESTNQSSKNSGSTQAKKARFLNALKLRKGVASFAKKKDTCVPSSQRKRELSP